MNMFFSNIVNIVIIFTTLEVKHMSNSLKGNKSFIYPQIVIKFWKVG